MRDGENGTFGRFRGEARIHDQNMAFEQGASCALAGASGCGKTTLLNMLAGVLTPDTGAMRIDGRDMAAASPREKDDFCARNIGFIFQGFKRIGDMTVEDNLRLLELERVDVSSMDAVLDSLGIRTLRRRRVRTLSGGEKQRVAMADRFDAIHLRFAQWLGKWEGQGKPAHPLYAGLP